jgi:heme-degrading monooxygenase HmoA
MVPCGHYGRENGTGGIFRPFSCGIPSSGREMPPSPPRAKMVRHYRRRSMIARIWRGITLAEKADAYIARLNETGLKDYANTPGNRGVTVLRRVQGEHSEIVLISLWDSMEAVRAFAGENPERSVYYPEDENYLLEMEPLVRLYEVAETAVPPPSGA